MNLQWRERGDGLTFLVDSWGSSQYEQPIALYGDFGDCWTYSSTLFRGYARDAEAARVAVLANTYVGGWL